jgi:chromosome segregation ATPase
MIGVAVTLGLLGVAASFGLAFYLRGQLTGGVSKALEDGKAKVLALHKEFNELLVGSEQYGSKKQLQALELQRDTEASALESQRQTLKAIEAKLAHAQKQIEEKEAYHQDLKTAKAEDEAKLKVLLERYSALSSEAISLEQQVAQSMKDLDSLMATSTLTPEQKAVFTSLSENLEAAGNRLRDLITEYETVNGRLKNLAEQLVDLENEYTRLIEQQLGD